MFNRHFGAKGAALPRYPSSALSAINKRAHIRNIMRFTGLAPWKDKLLFIIYSYLTENVNKI
jgi:hypothetical protein